MLVAAVVDIFNNKENKNGKGNNGRVNNMEQKQVKTRLVCFLKNEKDNSLKHSKSKTFSGHKMVNRYSPHYFEETVKARGRRTDSHA